MNQQQQHASSITYNRRCQVILAHLQHHHHTLPRSHSQISTFPCRATTATKTPPSQQHQQPQEELIRWSHEQRQLTNDSCDDHITNHNDEHANHRIIVDSHSFLGPLSQQHNRAMIQHLSQISDDSEDVMIKRRSHLLMMDLHRRVKLFHIRERVLKRIWRVLIDIYRVLEHDDDGDSDDNENDSENESDERDNVTIFDESSVSYNDSEFLNQKSNISIEVISMATEWLKTILSLSSTLLLGGVKSEENGNENGNDVHVNNRKQFVGSNNEIDKENDASLQLIAQTMKKLPIVPYYMTLVLNSAEISLQVFTTLSLATLVASVQLHKAFQIHVKPFVLYYSLLLDIFLRQRLSRFSSLSDMRQRTVLYVLSLISQLRHKNPDLYYRLITMYLKAVGYATIPKEMINSVLYLLNVIYFYSLLFGIYVLKNLSPRLKELLEKSWTELYDLVGVLLSFVVQSELYKEMNEG